MTNLKFSSLFTAKRVPDGDGYRIDYFITEEEFETLKSGWKALQDASSEGVNVFNKARVREIEKKYKGYIHPYRLEEVKITNKKLREKNKQLNQKIYAKGFINPEKYKKVLAENAKSKAKNKKIIKGINDQIVIIDGLISSQLAPK